MTTLQTAMVDLAELLPGTVKGTATGGSTTTLVDTGRTEPDGHWTGGTVLFSSGNNKWKSAKPTNYTSSSGTITFSTQTAACASGDMYTLSIYDRFDLVRAINQALQECGMFVDVDRSLSGDGTTTEFTLPDGVSDIRRVTVGQDVNYDWTIADGTLIFGTAPVSDVLYIYYVGYPAELSLDGDIIATANPTRLKWTAVYYALFNRMMYAGNDPGYLKDAVTVAQQQKTIMEVRFPLKLMPADPKHNAMWM